MASAYGHKLNPYRSLKQPLGVKGIRQTVVITNNPSTIDQNQTLLVRFPNLGVNDVIVPGSVRLAFEIALTSSTDVNRTIVNNLSRAIIKKKAVKIEGNEVLSVDDCDVYDCFNDLWTPPPLAVNGAYQGISISSDGSDNENMLALRVNAGNKDVANKRDKSIADVFGNRFYIPLDFELLDSHMPFYQSALADRLSYELTFNDYSRVIKASDTAATYGISGISFEYEMVTNTDLARQIKQQLQGRVAVLYERVLRHRKMTVNKSDTVWNINLNTPAKSLKGVLMLFEDPASGGEAWDRDTREYYNPLIEKVEVTIEGIPNQLFAHGMKPYQQWDETLKRFGGNPGLHLPDTIVHTIKSLGLLGVSLSDYLTSKFCCWLDMRTTDDDGIHGSGRRIENGSEGITIQITKKAESPGALNMYLYVIMDAQLNIEDGRFKSALY